MKPPVWYRWPEGYHEDYLPWFVILRRLAVAPFLWISVGLACFFVLLGFGRKEMKQFLSQII